MPTRSGLYLDLKIKINHLWPSLEPRDKFHKLFLESFSLSLTLHDVEVQWVADNPASNQDRGDERVQPVWAVVVHTASKGPRDKIAKR
jgi:hypothetical protein